VSLHNPTIDTTSSASGALYQYDKMTAFKETMTLTYHINSSTGQVFSQNLQLTITVCGNEVLVTLGGVKTFY
jgi:hypothetical protein